jgi:F-type H+-transporting ATPase subunit b
MEALGINLGYLIVQILNFAILMVVLRVWAYKPIIGLLEKRRETIAQGLEDARIAAEARENAENEAEAIISEAQSQANRIVHEANERAEEVAASMKTEAEKEAEDIRQTAVTEGEQRKERALGEVRGQVGALAIAAAQKVIGEALDEKRQQQLIEEFFSGIESGKVVVLQGEKLSGDAATVTSALPLSEVEQQNIRTDLRKQIGAGGAVEFQVDPSILGGLVVQVGGKIIDGSVAAKLTGLQQSLT